MRARLRGSGTRATRGEDLSRLPYASVDRLARPFLYFVRVEAMAGVVLLASTAAALALANSPWSQAFIGLWQLPVGVSVGALETSRSLQHWINDGLMTLFFFVISLELKRELVLGELRNPRVAALPMAAALGGMLVPVGVFLMLVEPGPQARGWGTVMSTDTAFVIGCLAVLGSRIPGSLRLFLLSLAIFDDVGAVLVVAVGYGGPLDAIALALAAGTVGAIVALGRMGVRGMSIYVALGVGLWVALDRSGLHATVAGVILGLLAPSRRWVSDTRLRAILDRVTARPLDERWGGNAVARHDLSRAGIATREALSPIERLELALHPWVAFAVLPLFALANAGVPLRGLAVDGGLALAVAAAFVLGKPAGVALFAVAAVRTGIAIRPPSLPWRLLLPGSVLTGIGFTMALFIADLAFDAGSLASAKLGILVASVACATLGLGALAWATAGTGHRNARAALPGADARSAGARR
ncbi:Na+/H+ antiporter NhaA [Pseudoxanthomonas kaohsiungensis]|uniref:Na+/H+ antiporter NhaA n=1 Tax=Pseudoxanthomonas kaohsiungensis TaxID=283923 RepID=UPI0035B26AA0